MKHLVVDARLAFPAVDGIHTYLRNIVPPVCASGEREGQFRTTLLVHPEMGAFWRDLAPTATVQPSLIRPMRPPQNWQIPRAIASLDPDLYFYPAHDPPAFLRTPFIFTIHDVTLFRMRPYFERLDRAKRTYLRVVTPAGLRRARAVLAVSNATRREIGDLFGANLLPKVHVTPNAITVPADVPGCTEPVGPPCLLYVGTDRPHKNLHRLVRAYSLARRRHSGLPKLELVGIKRTGDELAQTIKDEGVRDHVVMRGHISPDDLEKTYRRALALIFPSIAEGFGLPILEAMVRRVPVITSDVSACAEVAGDAAYLVSPFDVSAIADGIIAVASRPGLRSELVERGLARSALYKWERTAALTFDIVKDCLGAPLASGKLRRQA